MGEDIVAKEAPPFRGAFLEGPTYDKFSDEAFGRVYERLEEWLLAKGVKPKEWISHFYESPDSPPEEGRSEACISFEGTCSPSEGIDVMEVPAELVASYKTTLDKVESPEDVYEGIYRWISENGYVPTGSPYAREIYRSDPWETEASETEVEFQVPIRKE